MLKDESFDESECKKMQSDVDCRLDGLNLFFPRGWQNRRFFFSFLLASQQLGKSVPRVLGQAR
jgi:hypothetical protein